MAGLSDYTSYASIRAALGVGAKELPDSVLSDDLYLYTLKSELRELGPTLASEYAAAKLLVTPPQTTVNFMEAVSLFSGYCVAISCADVISNIAPKSITDGKAAFVRDPRVEVASALASRYDMYRVRLQEAYAVFGSGSSVTGSPYVMAVASVPDSDPVLGT